MARVFISYKRQDKDIVFPIVDEIKQKTGIDCWIDLEGIESGDLFQNVIIDAIDNADIVVFMLSKNFIAPYRDEMTGEIDLKKQTFPEKEVMYALRHNKRLIPISIDGTVVYDCKWLEFNCSGLDCINWFHTDDKEKLILNLLGWSCRRICILGEFSSGKTFIAKIINDYFKGKGEIVNSTFSFTDISFVRNSPYSIDGFDLLGNYITVERSSHAIKIFDVAMMPNIEDFSQFISKIDGIIYVKNILHSSLTSNDIFRICQIYKQNMPFTFVFTHCDTVNIKAWKSELVNHLTSNGIKEQNIEFLGLSCENDIKRVENVIEEMISIIDEDWKY